MKIIFLDIDGVMNSIEAGLPRDWNTPGSHIEKSAKLIEKPKVRLLNKLIEETGAQVVISSSWRKAGSYYGWSPDEMQTILNMRGFTGKVIDEIPKVFGLDGQQLHREDEIREWIDRQVEKPKHIVVLDDMELKGNIVHHHVRTNQMNGLTEDDIGIAQAIAGKIKLKRDNNVGFGL